MADFLESYLTIKQHVLVRFGRWRKIIAQDLPADRDLYCSNVAMMHYAKAVAHSALGHVAEAEAEKASFIAAKARVPKSRRMHNNVVVDLLGVELEYRKGNYDLAFAHLPKSVELRDSLLYDELLGLDAANPPRARCVAARAGARRGSRGGVSLRSRS
jgi:hypothetical protein